MSDHGRRDRDRSPSSVNQCPPEEQIPEGRHGIWITTPGGRTLRKTRRKRVIFRNDPLPPPLPEPIPDAIVGDTEQPQVVGQASFANNEAGSRAGSIRQEYNLRADEELWEYVWGRHRRAMRAHDTPLNRYLAFLDAVDSLYWKQVLLEIDLPDESWIFVTMDFFPNNNLWNWKKNDIVKHGPNDHFVEFRDHMIKFVRRHM